MKRIITLLLLFVVTHALAQDETIKGLQSDANKDFKKDPNDTIVKTWKTGSTISFNLAQGSLSNWAAGGDNFSLSLNSYINGYAFYKKEKHSWDNNLDMYYGYVKTTSLGTRKNDDRFDLTSKYGYALSPKVNLSALFDFRSQFSKGYNYPENKPREYTSNFMAPAYIMLSPGIDWHPVPNLSIFVSPLTARWVIVNDDSLSAKGAYGVDTGKKSNFEFGAFASINYKAQITKTISYKGRLDLFSNYRHNPQNVDLYMTNMFAVKLSKILTATWSLDLIYDDDVKQFGPNLNSPGLQLKSLIGVGLLVKLRNY
ncbi:DUF3078 domain-containing protein [Danxiaibacter flavus]|uniref:DUF3078 domain-containing protein n=1 Tax=Danxiaibacter flavus TaxID=3049108 RepID=A0ABV3ZK83_9BACT|nr:DUF3078 domain-containing protein [Chitinophagaceae bacterium DXS]